MVRPPDEKINDEVDEIHTHISTSRARDPITARSTTPRRRSLVTYRDLEWWGVTPRQVPCTQIDHTCVYPPLIPLRFPTYLEPHVLFNLRPRPTLQGHSRGGDDAHVTGGADGIPPWDVCGTHKIHARDTYPNCPSARSHDTLRDRCTYPSAIP